MKDIELRIKELRKERHLSQEDLASQLGVSRQAIIALEQGESFPSLPLVVDMLNFFELPFEAIVCFDGIRFEEGGEKEMAKDITPWSPFRDIDRLHSSIDRMFEDSLFGARLPVPTVAIPVVNVRDKGKEIIVEAEIPGVEEKDLDIEITDDTLTIRGQKKIEEEVNEKDYYRREFSYGSFSRAVALPVAVQEDKAEAELIKGTLTIRLPKVEEVKPKGKKIEIKKK